MASLHVPAVSAKPSQVAQGSADDLGVMSINLKDIVKPQVVFRRKPKRLAPPNEAGLGGYLPPGRWQEQRLLC